MQETMAHLVAKYEYRKCTSAGNSKIMFCYQTLTCTNAEIGNGEFYSNTKKIKKVNSTLSTPCTQIQYSYPQR